MTDLHDLEDELRLLGRTAIIDPPADDLAERVLARALEDRPGRVRQAWRWLVRSRRRLVAMIIAAVIIALGLTPPVRAAVLEWLRIGGVVIKTAPPPDISVSASPQPPVPVGPSRTLAEAQRLVDFPLGVPAELGTPDRVSVSDDRRVVSMSWGTGASQVDIEQFDGQLSWVFVKKYWQDVTPTMVSGRDAVWLSRPHPIVYVDREGVERTAGTRISGPSLVWQRADVTLRLEGNVDQPRAQAIAESVR